MNVQKFETLTWLRGLAAFFVIVNHSTISAREQYSPNDSLPFLQPLDFLNLGMFAVYLFFALSGCTLTLNYSHKIKSFSDFIPFYVKRFFRIWPAFAVSMIIFIGYREAFKYFYEGDTHLWIGQLLREYSITNIFQYLSLTFNITGPRGLFNGPYWSLPVEFQYYLMLPFALIIMKTKYLNLVVPVVFAAACYTIYSLKLIRMDSVELFKMGFSFFGGVLLAKSYQYSPVRLSLSAFVTILLMFVMLVGAVANQLVSLPQYIPVVNDTNNFFGLCALVVVAVALVTRVPPQEGAISRFLTLYGEISYSTYLFHMLFVGVAVILVIDMGIHNYFTKLLFILTLTFVGSYFFSLLTFRFVEKPSVLLGAKITKNILKQKKVIKRSQ